MSILNSFSWWLSFRKSANFQQWVRDTYPPDELRGLVEEVTDVSLVRLEELMSDRTVARQRGSETLLKQTTERLIRRYGDEIWTACLRAGGYNPGMGTIGLDCLARLPLHHQVHNQPSFEEFLVRNALRRTGLDILQDDHIANAVE